MVLVAHDGKFSKKAPHVVTHMSKVNTLITNGDPSTYFDSAATLEGLDIIRV